jgi:signal transduction histidine kinase/CheY-like chemotaxis protein
VFKKMMIGASSPVALITSPASRRRVTRLILGGTALVVGLATYGSYQVVRNATLENLKQNALLKVHIGADEIDQWVALRKSETAAIANVPITQTMDWTAMAPYFTAEQQRLKTFESYLGVIDPQGRFANVLQGQTDLNLSDRLHFKRGMAGQSTVLDPIISRVTGKPIIVFAAPIWSAASEPVRRPIGVVNAPIGIEKVTGVVRRLEYGDGSYAFALNSQGAAISHPDAALMSTIEKPASSLTESQDPALAAIAQKMVNRQQGIEWVTLAGVQKYVAFLPLKEVSWSVALVIPREQIESQLRILDGIAGVILALVGTLIGALVYVQSIEQAQLKKSKRAADAANQAKSELLSNMSHELRTPLNGILGYAQILGRSKQWGEPEQRGIQIIHQCGTHLLTLINDILDLAKIEARKLELVPAALHFPSFLEDIVELIRIRAEAKDIEFHYEPDDALPAGIQVDEKRLRQVLINLLGNAVKFTDRGYVTLRVGSIATAADHTVQLRFRVVDTGVGIAPDDMQKIFQAFEQVGEQRRQTEGTGLGLSISQQIVQLMGGRIQAQSQLGEGSEFHFEIEVPVTTDWSPLQTTAGGHIVGYIGPRRHLLIIDDRWQNRAVLLNLLEPLGFVLSTAEDGQAGLEQMRRHRPDLVITDVAMPVMDGLVMVRQLRADADLRSLKVIVSSASVAQLDQQISLGAGGNDFLPKPVDVNHLFSLLEKHLELTWIHEETTPSASLQPPSDVLVPPPASDLQTWLDLVQEGRLKKLIETAEQLGQQEPRYQPWVQQITQLARQFQSEQLEELLQELLQTYLP